MAGYERRISVFGERLETIDAHRIAGVLIRLAKAERERAQGLARKAEPEDPAMGAVKEIPHCCGPKELQREAGPERAKALRSLHAALFLESPSRTARPLPLPRRNPSPA
ncbi:hypothetical protein [Glycomyces sp. YM15]|uniref:hypothetical protein n=1 Tax=Glycomyces sp. YM15 TaxID=2800446 RepID=UPI0019629E1C|nr:hypothetical protein [Glycomyces sp. YM15]